MAITKSGVITSTGIPNANLIPLTSSAEVFYTYPASSYSDKYSKKTTIIPTGTTYTLSFWAKSTVSGDKIRAHYYNPNTTTYGISNQGTTSTASDGHMNFTLTTEWQQYWVTYTQSATTATKTVIFPRLVSGQGAGTISIKKVKFEEGSVPTAWVPNETDTVSITQHGFIENNDISNASLQKNGYWNCKEIIEL